MNINLHIKRLIVDDLGIQPQQRAELKAAVATAIQQQLLAQGLGSAMASEANRALVSAGSISVKNNHGVESLGQQIGHAVYGGIRHE